MGQGLVFLEAQTVLVQTLINTSVEAQVGTAQVLGFCSPVQERGTREEPSSLQPPHLFTGRGRLQSPQATDEQKSQAIKVVGLWENGRADV